MEIEFDIKKTVEENAATYFDKSKKSKSKVSGATEAIQKFKDRLDKLLDKRDREKEQFDKVKPETIQRKKEWYEKFRWFISSEGFLCVGGRDAATNDIVVKKHTEEGDIVFHTEAPGSPFFVVKAEGKEIGDATKEEVAIATASYSRAWKLGLATADVYWVKPDQLSKTPKSGEFLGRGAFVLTGKRNYSNPVLKLAVGITKEGAIMGGPESAVKKNCKKVMIILQGKNKASDVAKKVKKKLGGDLDEIIRALPAGNSDAKE